MGNGYFPESADKNACLIKEKQEQTYCQKPEKSPARVPERGSFESPVAEGGTQGHPSDTFAPFAHPALDLAAE